MQKSSPEKRILTVSNSRRDQYLKAAVELPHSEGFSGC